MQWTIHLTTVGAVLLSTLLIWGCWAVEQHLRLDAVDKQ